jgi:Xaa-Pro aminopeptidase
MMMDFANVSIRLYVEIMAAAIRASREGMTEKEVVAELRRAADDLEVEDAPD